MPVRFRLELEVVLNSDSETRVVAFARQRCAARHSTDAQTTVGRLSTPRGPEAAARTADALIELVEGNPLLSELGVEIERISCAPESAMPAGTISAREEHAIDEDELDDFESGLYICRWPNGEFSVVKAESKREAILALDEWGGAEPAWLVPMETCMIDFRLSDEAEIELSELGEETADLVWDVCFPDLAAVLSDDIAGQHSNERSRRPSQRIRRAVEYERTRLWDENGDTIPAKTALGRSLQDRLRTTGPVADHYVQQLGKKMMRGKSGEKGKPN